MLNLAAVLRDGRQPLLVLHEIAGGLALLEPLSVAFSQGDHCEEQQRQRQPPVARSAHRGLGLDLGGSRLLQDLMSFPPTRRWRGAAVLFSPPPAV